MSSEPPKAPPKPPRNAATPGPESEYVIRIIGGLFIVGGVIYAFVLSEAPRSDDGIDRIEWSLSSFDAWACIFLGLIVQLYVKLCEIARLLK